MKALGNAVVWKQVYPIIRAIAGMEDAPVIKLEGRGGPHDL